MDLLPNELLEIIFCYVDSEALFNCQDVCKQWRQIIIQRFWATQLSSYSEKDHYLEQHFLAAGWHKNINDDDLIRKLYLKLTRMKLE